MKAKSAFFIFPSLLLFVGCQTYPLPEITQSDLQEVERSTSEFLTAYTQQATLPEGYFSRDFERTWKRTVSLKHDSGFPWMSADIIFETQAEYPEIRFIGPAVAEPTEIHVPVTFQHTNDPSFTKIFVFRRDPSAWKISDILGSPHHDAGFSLKAYLLEALSTYHIWRGNLG